MLYKAKVGWFGPKRSGFGGGLAKVAREPVWPANPWGTLYLSHTTNLASEAAKKTAQWNLIFVSAQKFICTDPAHPNGHIW
jgi:hypothetical protein